MSKLVVFDVDGTFLDSFGIYRRIVSEYSAEAGLPMPCLKSIQEGYGEPHKYDFKWGVSKDEQLHHLRQTFIRCDVLTQTGHPEYTPTLFDNVEETFIHLKDLGHTLAIVTSKPEAPLLHLLEYHGVQKYFTAHRTRDDVKRRGEREKPFPDQLQSVIRELKFTPEETVMVGDTTMDVRMGRSSGAHTIGVTWGTHTKEHLIDAGAHHVLEEDFLHVAETVKVIF